MLGTIVIFGGSGGIGSAVARAIKARGYTVHLVGRDVAKLAATAEALGGASYSSADVEDEASVITAISEAGETLAGLLRHKSGVACAQSLFRCIFHFAFFHRGRSPRLHRPRVGRYGQGCH